MDGHRLKITLTGRSYPPHLEDICLKKERNNYQYFSNQLTSQAFSLNRPQNEWLGSPINVTLRLWVIYISKEWISNF